MAKQTRLDVDCKKTFSNIIELLKSGYYWDDTAQAIVNVDVRVSSAPMGIYITAKCDFGMHDDEAVSEDVMDSYVRAFKDFYSGAVDMLAQPFAARAVGAEFKTSEGGKVAFQAYLNDSYLFFDNDRLDKIDAENPYLSALRLVKQKDCKLIFVPWSTPVAKDGKYSVDDINVLPPTKVVAISANFLDAAHPVKTLKAQIREAVAAAQGKHLTASKSGLTRIKPKKA